MTLYFHGWTIKTHLPGYDLPEYDILVFIKKLGLPIDYLNLKKCFNAKKKIGDHRTRLRNKLD